MRPCLLIIFVLCSTILGTGRAGAEAAAALAPSDDSETAGGERPDARAFAHPSRGGLIGGVHVVDASSGRPGTFRVALAASYFGHDGFIAPRDHHRHASGALTINVTPIAHLELAAQLASYATENRTTDPEVVQVIGDVLLLAKSYGRVARWLALGGDASLALLNGIGSMGVAGAATTVGLRAAATADLRTLARRVPLLLRTNLRYVFDNSARLVRATERNRYEAIADPLPVRDEYRHLLSPAERHALQINRLDRLGLSLGVELPLQPHERVHISPLLEWGLALPINRQGYDCVVTRVSERDRCLAQEGFAVRPSKLTVGVRLQPWIAGLGLLLAVDVATSGHRTFVRELAPEARYMLQLGLSYAYEPRAAAPRTPAEAIAPAVGAAPIAREVRGHVLGQVVDAQTGAPIPEAVVHFENTALSAVLSGADGTFRSAELPPGPQGMRIRAQGRRETLCVAVLPSDGADVGVRCELAPLAVLGNIRGVVQSARGAGVSRARITLRGPSERTLVTDLLGGFREEALPEGEYALRVEAEGYFTRRGRLSVAGGRTATPELTLYPRPKQPHVIVTSRRILLRRGLQVGADGAVAPESQPLIAELAEQLEAHPEVKQVEIQGHVDASGDDDADQRASEQRANAVRDALVAAGVDAQRLRAVGYGSSRPVVPNITAQNRARNRRIELALVK